MRLLALQVEVRQVHPSGFMALVFAMATVPFLAGCSEDEDPRVEEGKAFLNEYMPHPESTQFRNVFLSEPPDRGSYTCGEFNTRAYEGDYQGFKRFITMDPGILKFVEGDVFDYSILGPAFQTFDDAWDAFCSNAT